MGFPSLKPRPLGGLSITDSSNKEFQALHESHLPDHLGYEWLQIWQTKVIFFLTKAKSNSKNYFIIIQKVNPLIKQLYQSN